MLVLEWIDDIIILGPWILISIICVHWIFLQFDNQIYWLYLTHWGRVTHICVGKLSIIGSDNGLSPSRCQAIIWTNVGILLIGTLGTNFSDISIEIYTFSLKKMHLKMSSGKWRPCCLGLNALSSLWRPLLWLLRWYPHHFTTTNLKIWHS